MSKTVYTENVVDINTGELTSKRWITKKVENTDTFIRTYVQDIGDLAKCSGSEQSVILCCLKYLDYNTNVLYLDNKRRIEIASCGNLKINTVNCAISRLVQKRILIKESSAKYILNPKLFFFGTDIERNKQFELIIKYNIQESSNEKTGA